MDDYLIATSSSIELHWQATHDLLDLIKQHDLFIKPEKGSPHGQFQQQSNKSVHFWAFVTTTPFVPKFSHVARPLNELAKKGVQFIWGQKEQWAFETLKAKLVSELILRQPQLAQQFEIEVDTLGFAIGVVLMQKDQEGKRHPVAYFSATLTEAEQNYNIFSLKLYAIVWALHHWRAFVVGSPKTIIIYTDHANLQYWREPHKVP